MPTKTQTPQPFHSMRPQPNSGAEHRTMEKRHSQRAGGEVGGGTQVSGGDVLLAAAVRPHCGDLCLAGAAVQ